MCAYCHCHSHCQLNTTNYFRYWHRPLNLRKLMEVNYPGLRQNMSLQRARKVNRLSEVSLRCHLETGTCHCYYHMTMAQKQ